MTFVCISVSVTIAHPESREQVEAGLCLPRGEGVCSIPLERGNEDERSMAVTWGQFAERDPELAALGEKQLARTGLALVGTLRRDGWPRISPVEPFIVDGNLYLGMMWQSRKAVDLLRDPRCVVHTARLSTAWAVKVSSRCTGMP